MQPPYREHKGQNQACCFPSLCHGEMSQCRRKYCGQHSGGLDSTPLCTGTGQANLALRVWLFLRTVQENPWHSSQPKDLSFYWVIALASYGSVSQLVVEQRCSCRHHSWNRDHLQLPCSWWAHESLLTKRRQGRVWQVRMNCRKKAGGTFLSLPKYMKNQPQSRFRHSHIAYWPVFSHPTEVKGICLKECKLSNNHCLLLHYTNA